MVYAINIRNKSNVNIIAQLLKFEGQINQTPILYKKTAKSFKRKFGIELSEAPVIFTAHGSIWKLSHHTFVSSGRTFESADYLPIVACKDKFKRLERIDIYNKIYGIK